MFVTAVGDVRADNAGMAIQPGYLLAGQVSEVERLRTIATAWEPAGQALLDRLPAGEGLRAVDLGCGPMGWLRLLSRWVGDRGIAVGTDVQPDLLGAAAEFAREEGLANTQLVSDDLFNSVLPAQGFDLVHARFELAPIGRAAEQFAAYRRLCKPGGWLIVEDPVSSSWQFNPTAPAAQRLVRMIVKAFADGGGDFDVGRRLPELFHQHLGLEPALAAQLLALPHGHPFLDQPLALAAALRTRLAELMPGGQLDRLIADARHELSRPLLWGTSFTLIQAWARVPG